MSVAIDTNVLIYALNPHPNYRELTLRAEALLDRLEHDNVPTIPPSWAMAEFLAGIELPRHAGLIAELQQRFLIVEFDARAASKAGELMAATTPTKKQSDAEKALLHGDIAIIATARIAGCTAIYSHDALKLRSVALRVGLAWHDLPAGFEDMFKQKEAEKRLGLSK